MRLVDVVTLSAENTADSAAACYGVVGEVTDRNTVLCDDDTVLRTTDDTADRSGGQGSDIAEVDTVFYLREVGCAVVAVGLCIVADDAADFGGAEDGTGVDTIRNSHSSRLCSGSHAGRLTAASGRRDVCGVDTVVNGKRGSRAVCENTAGVVLFRIDNAGVRAVLNGDRFGCGELCTDAAYVTVTDLGNRAAVGAVFDDELLNGKLTEEAACAVALFILRKNGTGVVAVLQRNNRNV